MMRTFTIAAAMAVLLVAPAYSQGRSSQGASGQTAAKTPLEIQDELRRRETAEIERQYERRAKVPEADAKNDPWRNMRSTETPPQRR